MLRLAAAIATLLMSAPTESRAAPEPWRTYTDIAAQIACPEYDRLLRADVTDSDRLQRTRADCWDAIARDNPGLVRTLLDATERAVPAPRPTPAELAPAGAEADVARLMPTLGPARTIAHFLLTDAARCSRQRDDEPAAARITAAAGIARQLNTGNTGLEWIVAETIYVAIIDHAGTVMAEDALGPAAARAILDAHTAYTTIHRAQLHRAIDHELAAARGSLRHAGTQLIRILHSPDAMRFAQGAQRPNLMLLAALSQARALLHPHHAIRHEATLRALAARSLHDGPARRMITMAALYAERYDETIARLREITHDDLAQRP